LNNVDLPTLGRPTMATVGTRAEADSVGTIELEITSVTV
jgi:hypothetical protein